MSGTISRQFDIGDTVWAVDKTIPSLYAGIVTNVLIDRYMDSGMNNVNLIRYMVNIPSISKTHMFDESSLRDNQNDGLLLLSTYIDEKFC